MCIRNRTSLQIIDYDLYLYFLGLSLRNTTAKPLSFLKNNKDNSCINLELVTKVQTKEIFQEKETQRIYVIDKTMIKAGSELVWLLRVVIEPKNKEILATDISKKRNISITKPFLSHVVNKYD